MKICGLCKIPKSVDDFHKRKRSKDGLQSICKTCNRTTRNEYYKNEPSIQQGLARKLVQRNRDYIFDILKNSACCDCGETNPCLLEFDHETGIKSGGVCEGAIRGWSLTKLQAEIDKCTIRCVGCHRLKSLKQSNAWIYKRHYLN